MHIPQEIQDELISIFLEDVPRELRKEALNLRLVCQAWMLRVNFHMFRNLKMEIRHCLQLRSILKMSKFSVGSFIKHLSIHGEDTIHETSIYHKNEDARQDYLRDLIKFLPCLESLQLTNLLPNRIDWLPCFSTIKNLGLLDVSMWPSQIIRLISTAVSLEILRIDGGNMYKDGSMEPDTLPPPFLSSEGPTNLKLYEAWMFANRNVIFMEYSHLRS